MKGKRRDREICGLAIELMLTPALQGLVAAQEHQTEILEQCAQWIDEGKLNIHLSQTVPLSDAVSAHQAIESGSTTGKIALQIA
ncbi:MAG: zinc-binding dehydrogenase [Coleofasciculus sp. C1-SOL-03]